jgi:hypothetical protein
MKVARYRLRLDSPGAKLDLPPEATRPRFGDDLLLVFDETRWDALAP